MLFEEPQRWKDMIWLARSYPTWPSNLEISEGSLVSMAGQVGSRVMRSFIKLLKSDKLRPSMYGNQGGRGGSYAILSLWGE